MEDIFMDTAKVMAKGQVTIPKKIRELLNLENGDYVTFVMGHISPVSCTSARDNKTTRYAGARRRLYPKTLPFGTIKVVQALL